LEKDDGAVDALVHINSMTWYWSPSPYGSRLGESIDFFFDHGRVHAFFLCRSLSGSIHNALMRSVFPSGPKHTKLYRCKLSLQRCSSSRAVKAPLQDIGVLAIPGQIGCLTQIHLVCHAASPDIAARSTHLTKDRSQYCCHSQILRFSLRKKECWNFRKAQLFWS
jgi:hypothetical protein